MDSWVSSKRATAVPEQFFFFFFFFLENIITAGLAYPLVAVASGYYPYLYPSHTRMQKKKDR